MKLNLAMARAIAADWHGGQASPLYSFASTGKMHYPFKRYYEEVMGCLRGADEEQAKKLDALLSYLQRNRKLLKP